MYLDEIFIDMLPGRDSYVRSFEMHGTVARSVDHQLVVSNIGTIIRWDLKFYLNADIMESATVAKILAGDTMDFEDRDEVEYQVKVTNYREMGSFIQDGEFFPFLTEITMALETVFPVTVD